MIKGTYSYLRLSTGLDRAVFIAWYITVARDRITDSKNTKTNTEIFKSVE
jgi:hypothetical protein